ncbi:MAG: RimK-like ATPgrasp N-terminal domain-containing protein [Candidatus Bathyarchaeota archaeon]|nr:RimK-like ATPgrasp N-terminal domain-containing protein [Candidatus Bathyarchaeota archaeon]
MLVVSSIGLCDDLHALKPAVFLGSSIKDTTINLTNDYRYLKTGYYVSLHAEILGNQVIPSCENIIDASRTPILLLRASKAKIPTVPFLVTDNVKKIITEVGLPVVVFAVNPFIHEGYKVAKNQSALYRAMKSLGMNYKFAVCAEPLRGELHSVKSVFGKTELADEQISALSQKVYELFRIPLCKLHVQKAEDKAFLCGLEPLKETELSKADLKLISKEIMLISQQGNHIGV